MNEKIYKTMTRTGACSLAVGIGDRRRSRYPYDHQRSETFKEKVRYSDLTVSCE